MNPKECKGCFYFKPRDVDPEIRALAWGPWCLESGEPTKCADSILKCNKGWSSEDQNQGKADAQLALKYATRNKRKR